MEEILDYAGIGFGPFNLATCIALNEHSPRLKGMFFEKKNTFSWHKDMLVPRATMQVHFLKDLVTLRNPQSPFTFVNYLHSEGRIDSFINMGQSSPLRSDYSEYLRWAASHFNHGVRYGAEVVEIKKDRFIDGLQHDVFRLAIQQDNSSQLNHIYARSLLVATGPKPRKTVDLDYLDERIFHNSSFMTNIETWKSAAADKLRFAVVGSGQSAAEVIDYLYGFFNESSVAVFFDQHTLKPADASPFVNEIFCAEWTERFHSKRPERRTAFIREFLNTNYGVVDADMLESLYAHMYQDKIDGTERIAMMGGTRVSRVAHDDDSVHVTYQDLDTNEQLSRKFDAVVIATGYQPNSDIFEGIRDHLVFDDRNLPLLNRSYQAIPAGNDDRCDPTYVWIQGASESSHGLSDGLLSVMSIRAGEIATDMVANLLPTVTSFPITENAPPSSTSPF